MYYLFLLIPAALGLFVVWCVKSPVSLTGQVVYQHTDSERLFLYTRRWNVCGHRSARQDWWQEIELTGRGRYRRVGLQFKYNVGYSVAQDAPEWCLPFLALSRAQVLELDQAIRHKAHCATTGLAPG